MAQLSVPRRDPSRISTAPATADNPPDSKAPEQPMATQNGTNVNGV